MFDHKGGYFVALADKVFEEKNQWQTQGLSRKMIKIDVKYGRKKIIELKRRFLPSKISTPGLVFDQGLV